jgi:hypothetical protein
MKPKPKIYISHRDLSIEETAKMVGVSKRRTKELIALAAEQTADAPSHEVERQTACPHTSSTNRQQLRNTVCFNNPGAELPYLND